MRKIIFVLSILFLSVAQMQSCTLQPETSTNISTPQKTQEVYKLYPTENMWTFIKLDTRNGRLWQVQYSLESDKRFEYILSSKYLVNASKEVVGRFKLYPTKNTYNFVLLDQIDGYLWQVQWSFDQEKRFVIEIN